MTRYYGVLASHHRLRASHLQARRTTATAPARAGLRPPQRLARFLATTPTHRVGQPPRPRSSTASARAPARAFLLCIGVVIAVALANAPIQARYIARHPSAGLPIRAQTHRYTAGQLLERESSEQ